MLYTIVSTYGSFAAYDGPETGRLYIRVNDPENEQFFFGFSRQASTSNGTDGNLINTAYYFRIKDPNGNVVYGPQIIDNTTANADTWALATAGPAPVAGASGYTPFTFDPTGLSAGAYYIEFSANATTASTAAISIKYWDITVATKGGSPQALNGRLWSQRWSLRTPSISQGSDPAYTYYDRPFNGQIFLLTADGFVSEIDFNNSGFRGLSFNLSYNEYGVVNTGNFEADRRSVENVNSTLPEFKIFINDPDITAFPSGSIGEMATYPYIVDCDLNNLCVSYSVTQIGYAFILLDFDTSSGAGFYDPGTADVMLYENIVAMSGEPAPYERCTAWDGKDGLGNDVNLLNPIPVYFTYAQGLVHFPVYDVEYNVNGFTVTHVRPTVTGFTQKLYFDDGNITDLPGNGADKVMVNGCIPPCHAYTNFGYGDLNTINTWWYTNQDFVINFQPSDCTINAFYDTATTTVETPVVIDVLANDQGNIDNASVSNSGLLPPGYGFISINATTGAITYTPVPGFIGIDTFEYRVCDIGGSLCDTTIVVVAVTCGSAAGNVISGLIFADNNGNGAPNAGESGEPNVTVTLFQDNNSNGLVDGADTQISTQNTDLNGGYSFTVNPTFSGTYNYDDIPSGGIAINSSTACGTPIVRTFTVTQDMTVSDINVGFNASHAKRGDIRVTLESPTGTIVTIINNSNDSDTNYDLVLDSSSGNSLDDNNTDNVASPYYDRTAAPGNSLNAFNGESALGTWTLRICDSNTSTNNGTYNRSQLVVSGNFTHSYVMQIDVNDLPCGATMSTDNVETAVFIATNLSDCANNFGYVPNPANAIAGSNSPVCEGGNIQFSETGTGAVSWNWSGPGGFTSVQHNPVVAGATTSNAGTYSVTVTDANSCTASSTISVVVNATSNAGTAVANDSICIEGSGLSIINLFDKITSENSGGTWSVVSGSPGSNFNAGAGTLNPNGLPINAYTFRYTKTGTPPCPDDSEDWTITVYRCCPPQVCLPVSAVRNN